MGGMGEGDGCLASLRFLHVSSAVRQFPAHLVEKEEEEEEYGIQRRTQTQHIGFSRHHGKWCDDSLERSSSPSAPPTHPRNPTPNTPESLEALLVDNPRAALVVLLLLHPHGGEGGEGREDGTTNPDGVLALRRGHHLDLHAVRGQVGHLLRQAVGQPLVHGG